MKQMDIWMKIIRAIAAIGIVGLFVLWTLKGYMWLHGWGITASWLSAFYGLGFLVIGLLVSLLWLIAKFLKGQSDFFG